MLPGGFHDLLIGGNHRLLIQEKAQGLAKLGRQILQGPHGGLRGPVFNAGEHIPGDLLTAQRPLAEPRFQPGLPKLFPQGHGLTSLR